MIKPFLLAFFSILGISTLSQNEQPDWSSEMKRPGANFYDLIDLHHSFCPSLPAEKGQGFKQFERFKWLYSSRVDENGHLPNGADILRMWEEVKAYNAGRSVAGNWLPLGPILDDVTTRDQIEGVGRTSVIAFHPTNPEILFLGTPAGGVWRSLDGGETWSTNTDYLPTLGVSSIEFDPIDPQIIYVGTGDRDAFDSPGIGVIKSSDGGDTWELANVGIESFVVSGLKFFAGTSTLLAATDNGIYRSNDGAATWEQSSSSTPEYKDLEVHPTDPLIAYSTSNGRFYRTGDGGDTWVQISDGISLGTRMVIAVTPAAPDVVYVCKTNTYSFSAFYKSIDGGLTFTSMSTQPNIMGWAADGSSSGGQAWYDLCIAADYDNADIVYVGGIRVKKSIDSGATWIDINPNYVHVDQHEFAISPNDHDLYICNDGGVYHYIDNEEWLDISKGIVNGQIYKLGQSPHNANYTLTGFQDNGTSEYNGAQWKRRGGGDGFECIYDQTDQDWRYGSIYYGDVYRTSPDFINQKICGNGVLNVNEQGAWSSPFNLLPTDENTMYVGLKNVWRSRNIKVANKDSIIWDKISDNLMGSNTVDINSMECSSANENILYASEGQRKLARTSNALDSVVVWTNISSFLPSSLQPVTAIETNPSDTNIVYICFNKNAWKSFDRGQSWSSMTLNVPDVPMNTIVLDTSSTLEALYLGTDFGVYYKDSTMTDWISFSDGLPYSSRVTELEIYYDADPSQNRLKASTYGRGLWESDLYSAEVNNFPATALLSTDGNINEVFGDFEVNLTFYKNLQHASVSGLQSSEIWAENAVVTGLTGGPSDYVVSLTPSAFGEILIHVAANVAIDETNVPNGQSDTLQLVYVPSPAPFGPYGPGGVGDLSTISLWMRADRGVLTLGNLPASNGQSANHWQDITTNTQGALQNTISAMPTYMDSENGINNRPAIYFDGVNDFLQADNIISGRSASAYIMVETDSIAFNNHGWFASARVNNGFILHPWKNQSSFSGEVLDLQSNYSGSPVYYIGDAAAPHIYGFIYDQDDLHQLFYTVFDENLYPFPGIDLGLRNNSTPITIKFGWDYEDRFGKGKIAEHFLYNRRLFLSHHRLVNNYMAAQYGINLGPESRYHHMAQGLDVFGIGRESSYDLHVDAKGLGIIRIQEPSSLDDGDYLMIGDDGADLSLTSDSYPIISERSGRTWGFSKTGDLGNVLVSILTTDIPFSGAIGLIISDQNEFLPGGSVQFIPLDLNGDTYQAIVNFPASGVFTIGYSPEVGLPDLSFAEINLFPNPVNDLLTVNIQKAWPEQIKIHITDALGKTVHLSSHSGQSATIDIGHLAEGMYVAEIELDQKTLYRKQLIVK